MAEDNKSTKSDEFIELLYSQNETFIMFVKSVLDSAGIDYIVAGDNQVHIRACMVPSRVFVHQDDMQKARLLLKEYL